MMMLDQLIGMNVEKLIADLQDIEAKSAENAGLEKKVARLRKSLDATTQKLDRANAELADAETKLAQHQARIKQDYDNAMKENREQLEAAWIEEEKANHQLAANAAKIRDALLLESGLTVAIEQLADRIEGKQHHDGLIARIANQAPNT